MDSVDPFYCESKFYGLEHFPYGLERSGEFLSYQADLLVNHGQAYKALSDGTRLPLTLEEKEFVEFCRKGRSALSKHERVWQLYCSKIGRQHITTATAVPLDAAQGFIDDSDRYDDFPL